MTDFNADKKQKNSQFVEYNAINFPSEFDIKKYTLKNQNRLNLVGFVNDQADGRGYQIDFLLNDGTKSCVNYKNQNKFMLPEKVINDVRKVVIHSENCKWICGFEFFTSQPRYGPGDFLIGRIATIDDNDLMSLYNSSAIQIAPDEYIFGVSGKYDPKNQRWFTRDF